MNELITTTSTLEEFRKEFSALKQNFYSRIHYSRATKEQVFPKSSARVTRFLKLLKTKKLSPEFWRYIFTYEDLVEDQFVCLIRNPRYSITFSIDKGYENYIHLRQLYRRCPKDEKTNYKASQIIRKFDRICASAGYQAIILQPQPTRLSERLPYTPNGYECTSVLKQVDLIKFYERRGYQFLEEEDELMVKFLN
jgi:hypothetical protein